MKQLEFFYSSSWDNESRRWRTEYMKIVFDWNSLAWAIIGAIIGWVLPALIKKIYSAFKDKQYKKKVKIVNEEYIKSNDMICPISHGSPFFHGETLILNEPKTEFHFSMAEEIHKRILEKNKEFEHTDWKKDIYWGENGDSTLVSAIRSLCDDKEKESEIRKCIEKEKERIAQLFESKTNQAFFNGEMYGIKCINDRRKGNEEQANVEIQSIKTDYFTHRVMASVYQKLIDSNLIISPDGLENINDYYPFLTSIEMDVLLVIENKSKVVLTKRSKQLINMEENQWHLSVNEAISITDLVLNEISLDGCVIRGLKEELGITSDRLELKFYYGDIFFLKNPIEVGISAFVVADSLTEQDIRNGYNIAQDAPYESTGNDCTGLMFLKLNNKDVAQFCKENVVTPAALYCLKMLQIRKSKL